MPRLGLLPLKESVEKFDVFIKMCLFLAFWAADKDIDAKYFLRASILFSPSLKSLKDSV